MKSENEILENRLLTGIKDLDYALYAFKKGGLYFITGKRHLEIECVYVNLISNLFNQANLYCYCQNISPENLSENLLSNQTGINSLHIKRRDLHEEDLIKITKAIESKRKYEIVFNETPSLDFNDFISHLNEAFMKNSIRVVLVDSIFDFFKSINVPFEKGLYDLKQFAIKNNLVFITTNKHSNKRNSLKISSFKQDDNHRIIDKYFDVIITTFLPALDNSEILSKKLILKIVKNRFGDLGLTTIETNVDFYTHKIHDIDFNLISLNKDERP